MPTISDDIQRPLTFTEDLLFKVEEYFRTVSPEQLDADLKAADFDKWQKVGNFIDLSFDTEQRFELAIVCVL